MATEVKIPKVMTKKDLEHKLHIQHRNTRHDAVDIILEYFAEIEKENEQLIKKYKTPNIFDPAGHPIQVGTFNQYGYDQNKRKPELNELTRRIHNMKQRKPKEGE